MSNPVPPSLPNPDAEAPTAGDGSRHVAARVAKRPAGPIGAAAGADIDAGAGAAVGAAAGPVTAAREVLPRKRGAEEEEERRGETGRSDSEIPLQGEAAAAGPAVLLAQSEAGAAAAASGTGAAAGSAGGSAASATAAAAGAAASAGAAGAGTLGAVLGIGALGVGLAAAAGGGRGSRVAAGADDGSGSGGDGGGSGVVPQHPDKTAPEAPTLDLLPDSDTGNSQSDDLGSDDTPTVRVSLSGDAAGSKAPAAGDVVSLYAGAEPVGSATLSAADLDRGYVDITASALGADGAYSLSATVTDRAGNVSEASIPIEFVLDTAGPVFVRLAAHSNGGAAPGTIDLVYDEPMSQAGLPDAADFEVTINGVTHSATGVSASGNTVTLSFAPGVVTAGNLNLRVRYADPSAGDDATAVQDAAGNDAADLDIASGVVADGYIRGAQMYLDGPDGLIALSGVVTDGFGNFFLPADANPNGYPLVAVGGVNIDTGLPNTTPLKAPAGSTTINPLTTLVQAVLDQAEDQGQALDAEAAAQDVAAALGLTLPEGQSLTRYDPLSATDESAVGAQKAAAQVATLAAIAAAEAANPSDGAQAATKVLANLAAVVGNTVANAPDGEPAPRVDLADASVLAQALANVAVSDAAQVLIVEASTAIAAAQDLGAISGAQSQFIDRKAPDAPTDLAVAALTADATPAVAIRLNVSSTDGGAAVKGDTLVLLDGATEIGRIELTQAQIDAGRVVLDEAALAEGLHNLSARVIDKAGNTGAASVARPIEVDLTAPGAVLIAGSDNLAAGASTTLTLAFSEAVTGLGLGDLQVTGGGTLSGLGAPQDIAGQQVYTVTYTAPAAGGAGSVRILAGGYADAAGNEGAASNAVDLAAVNPPVVTIASVGGADRVVSGQAGDNRIQGTALDDFGAVTVKSGEITLGTATVLNGRWTYELSPDDLAALGQGADKRITATQTRSVGENDYEGSASADFAIDTAAPAGLSIDAVSGGAIGSADKAQGVIVTGSAEAGARVLLTVGSAGKTLVADGNGNWSYRLTSDDYKALEALPGGPSVSAVAVDTAGNRSAPETRSFAIDTAAPALGLVRLADADDTGTKADGRTADRQPSIQFTAEAGASLQLEIKSGAGDFTASGVPTTGTGALQTLSLSQTDLPDGTYVVRLTATDAAGNPSVRTATLVIDGSGPAFTSGQTATAIAENGGANQLVYTGVATDASVFSYGLKADAGDASAFAVDARTGQVRLLADPDFEARASYAFTIVATDAAGNASERAVTLQIQDLNEAPTAVSLGSVLADGRIEENTETAVRIRVADIVVTDDALGSETVTLTGADAEAFEVEDGVLYLKAGTALDHVAKPVYAVTVSVADESLAGSEPVTAGFALSVVDVNEAPAISTLGVAPALVTAGDAFVLTATLTEAVIVAGGTPTLTLEVGGQSVTASYSGVTGSATSELRFDAIAPQTGDGSGLAISGFAAGGATILGQISGRELSSPVGLSVSQFVVDNTAPGLVQIVSVAENSGSMADRITNDRAPVLEVAGESGLTLGLGSGGAPLAAGRYTVSEAANGNGTSVYTITVTDPAGLADGGYGVFAYDAAGNLTAPPLDQPSGASFRIDATAPAMPIIDAIDGDSGQPGDRVTSDSSPSLTVLAESGAVLRLGSGGQPLEASRYTVSESAMGDGTSVYTITVTDPAGLADGAYGVSATDAAGNTAAPTGPGSASFRIDSAAAEPRQTVEFEYQGDRYAVSLGGLDGYALPDYPREYEVSRFLTAAAVFRDAQGAGELRVIDLETGAVLAGRSLQAGEFLMASPDAGTQFHIGRRSEDTLTIESYDYGLSASDASLSGAPVSTVTVTLPAQTGALAIDQYIAAQAGQPGYLSVWNLGVPDGARELYSVDAETGAATPIALPDASSARAWIGNGFVLAGELWVSVFGDGQGSYHRLTQDGWQTVAEWDFWETRDFVSASVTVVRDGPDALDLRGLVPAGQTAQVWDEDRVERLPDGSLLVRAEAFSADGSADYELWALKKADGELVFKRFDSDAGFGLRSVSDAEPGFVYFQQVNVAFDQNGDLSQGDPALVAYRIALADVESVLRDASDGTPLDLLGGAPGVQQLASYTQAQLSGGQALQAGQIVWLDGYLPASVFAGQDAGALVLSSIYDTVADSDQAIVSRIEAVGTVSGTAVLPAEVMDVVLDPANGLFLLTDFDGAGQQYAYRVDPASGGLTQITAPLFASIAQMGGLPEGATFVAGTAGNDPIDLSAATTSQWIGADAGNDTLRGGSADDVLIGGSGGDQLFGNGGADVLIGMGGDDRLRGGGGADRLYGGGGTDRFQYGAPDELAGDQVTGNLAFWDGNPFTLSSGADPTTSDRIQLLGAGEYDFGTASVSYVDRIDIVSGVAGLPQGDVSVTITAQMAASADRNSDGTFGDIRVVGYDATDPADTTPPATVTNVTIDATALTAGQRLIVDGQEGSGVGDPLQAFGGLNGNDSILGGAGDDWIAGGKGNDAIDGGGGNDTAVFAGLFADYAIEAIPEGFRISDNMADRDGADTIAAIEILQFADGQYRYDETAGQWASTVFIA